MKVVQLVVVSLDHAHHHTASGHDAEDGEVSFVQAHLVRVAGDLVRNHLFHVELVQVQRRAVLLVVHPVRESEGGEGRRAMDSS